MVARDADGLAQKEEALEQLGNISVDKAKLELHSEHREVADQSIGRTSKQRFVDVRGQAICGLDILVVSALKPLVCPRSLSVIIIAEKHSI